jgi:subtilisin family serine protease
MNRIVYALFLFASVPFVGQDSFVLVTAPSKFQDVCSRHGLAPMAQLSTNSSKGIFLVSSFSPDPSISTDRDVQEFELNQKLNVPELSGTTNANLTQSTTSILDGLPGRTLLSYFGSVVPSNYVQQPAMSLIRLGEAQSATALTGKGVIVAVIDTGVDADHPARPGEAVHGYALGLGPTSPAVSYGNAAPGKEPFARLATPFGCSASSNPSAPVVEVFYQGLAPSLAGVYQFDFRIPAGTSNGNFVLFCEHGGIGSGGSKIFANVPVTAGQ